MVIFLHCFLNCTCDIKSRKDWQITKAPARNSSMKWIKFVSGLLHNGGKTLRNLLEHPHFENFKTERQESTLTWCKLSRRYGCKHFLGSSQFLVFKVNRNAPRHSKVNRTTSGFKKFPFITPDSFLFDTEISKGKVYHIMQ